MNESSQHAAYNFSSEKLNKIWINNQIIIKKFSLAFFSKTLFEIITVWQKIWKNQVQLIFYYASESSWMKTW